MFGPEFENIKEYKPYINKLEISEDIIDNEVDKLFENKQNKPEIKLYEKKTEILDKEKPLIKEKKDISKIEYLIEHFDIINEGKPKYQSKLKLDLEKKLNLSSILNI